MGDAVVSRRLSILVLLTTEGQRPARESYFFGGVAGCELFDAGFKPCSTEFEVAPPRDAMMESVIEVSMKITVDQVVALERTVADPRGPNAV